jgi:ribosomal protein S8
MIEKNEVSDFSPSKYPQKAQKSVKRNGAPGTAIIKTSKGILLEKKPRISRATTT